MNRAIPLILLLLGFTCQASGDSPTTTQPMPQTSQVAALFKELHPGMSLHDALGLGQRDLGGSWGKITYGHETGISRHALDGESSVILEFSVNGGAEVLTSFSLV